MKVKNKKLVILCLIFSLLIPISIILNFIKIIPNEMNEKRDTLPKLSNQNINITTPENKTYTEPMSGYYPGTYGFECDAVGTTGTDISFVDACNPPVEVIEQLDGHKHVLKIKRSGWGEARNYFTNQTSGTVEFWAQVDDSYERQVFVLREEGINLLALYVLSDYFSWLDKDSVWHDVKICSDDMWYHWKIVFRSDNTFDWYIDNVLEVDNQDFATNMTNGIDEIHFKEYDSSAGWFIDAVGYSWDPHYNIGDNLYEGLLLSFENNTFLDWTGYSLDAQTNKTILGNTTFPMPENGLHTIQVFGNDTFGTDYQSDVRYFSIDYFKDIEIYTPENKTYTEPMSGYYPATYGFENDEEGTFPNDWYIDETPGCTCEIIESFDNHKKIVNITDTILSNQANMINNLSNRDNGTIEFYYRIDDANKRNTFSLYETDSNDGIYLRVDSGYLTYRTDAYYNILPILNNRWYHISITFNSTIDKFWVVIDGTSYGGTSGYDYYSSNTMMKHFKIASSIYHENYSFYIDAIGYSWDPNYNIGENLNEGLLLSYNLSGSLDWMGYSLDGQANKTILGNTTIPMPGNGVHTIQVFANDTIGFSYRSELRYFTIDLSIADTISPVITILSPSSNALFGNTPPDFSISIVESNLHLIWYTMDGEITKFFIAVLNGTIDQDMWNSRPNGLNTVRFYANDTTANLGFSENIIEKDTAEPIITINSPNEGEIFTITPPTFSLSINESNLDSIWYTIDERPNSIFCSSTGQIDDQLWLVLEPGEHILHFYANDTLSNVGINEVIIVKGEVVPVVTFEQHYYPFFIFLIIAAGLVGLFWFINKKYK